MKRYYLFLITLLYFLTMPLMAMENVPSLQEIVLKNQFDQWEQKLHTARNADERKAICAEYRKTLQDVFHGHEALEAKFLELTSPVYTTDTYSKSICDIRGCRTITGKKRTVTVSIVYDSLTNLFKASGVELVVSEKEGFKRYFISSDIQSCRRLFPLVSPNERYIAFITPEQSKSAITIYDLDGSKGLTEIGTIEIAGRYLPYAAVWDKNGISFSCQHEEANKAQVRFPIVTTIHNLDGDTHLVIPPISRIDSLKTGLKVAGIAALLLPVGIVATIGLAIAQEAHETISSTKNLLLRSKNYWQHILTPRIQYTARRVGKINMPYWEF